MTWPVTSHTQGCWPYYRDTEEAQGSDRGAYASNYPTLSDRTRSQVTCKYKKLLKVGGSSVCARPVFYSALIACACAWQSRYFAYLGTVGLKYC